MNRKILFRGKRVDNGDWVEGDYQHNEGHPSSVIFGRNWGFHVVISETVGQYTGLTDKNGRRIFEGDVLKAENPKPFSPYIAAVKYEEARFVWGVYNLGEFENPEQLEIIGNIHDNPKLLGGNEND